MADKSRLNEGPPGKDHHAAIDVEINVLDHRMHEEDVLRRWGPVEEDTNPQWFLTHDGLLAAPWRRLTQ